MLTSALFAGIIPLLMWLYQKANDKESEAYRNLNWTIFLVLFVILGVLDISGSLSNYINYFEKYGSNNNSQILANKLAREIVLYLIVIFPVGWNQKSKIQKILKKIFSPTNSDKKQSNSYERKLSRTQKQPRRSRQKETQDKKFYCPSCYAVVKEEEKFCGECGFQLLVEEEIENAPLITKNEKQIPEIREVIEKVKEKVKEIKSPPQTSSTKDQLKEYKQLFDEGLISEEEYTALKKKALDL
tara:strand:+ start:1856 stop:2584 length:729 start_codon:yes stop_codon:yes gene_type:complete